MVLFDIQEEKLKPAVADLTGKGISAGYQVINVTLEADWTAAVKGVVDTYGRVDILVQAAGITGKTGIKTHEVDPANFDLVLGASTTQPCIHSHDPTTTTLRPTHPHPDRSTPSCTSYDHCLLTCPPARLRACLQP